MYTYGKGIVQRKPKKQPSSVNCNLQKTPLLKYQARTRNSRYDAEYAMQCLRPFEVDFDK